MVALAKSTPGTQGPSVRRIDRSDLHWALRQGWTDFTSLRGDILVVGFVYPLVVLLVAGIALGASLFPLLEPIVGGLALLGPLLAIGFYELARRRENGLDSRWTHFLDPLRGPARLHILAIGAFATVLFLGWLGIAWQIYESTLGRLEPDGVTGLLGTLFTTQQGWMLIILGNLTGLIFAAVMLAVTVATFPMLVDGFDASKAVVTSLRATYQNPLTVATWGLYVAVILILACIPFFIGLAIVLPVLGYATWHLYTRLVDRSETPLAR